MVTWAIGDVHGCWRTLERLLERIGWPVSGDRLWLVGDLVNRGPGSLEVLRWAVEHDELVTAVLGNHDLHLLLWAHGVAPAKRGDRLERVLAAPDRADLLAWLARRPFLHREGHRVLVHAGLLPIWGLAEAQALARALHEALRVSDPTPFLSDLVGGSRRWRAGIDGIDRLSAAAAAFTRLRTVRPDGSGRLGFTGAPAEARAADAPWFERSPIPTEGYSVIFGHWANLGLTRGSGYVCLDSGCVYGGHLSAWCVDDGTLVQVPYDEPVPPIPFT
jgi:bis(5'-nucleosyl)-tetraphosphatase (symmetrical)